MKRVGLVLIAAVAALMGLGRVADMAFGEDDGDDPAPAQVVWDPDPLNCIEADGSRECVTPTTHPG